MSLNINFLMPTKFAKYLGLNLEMWCRLCLQCKNQLAFLFKNNSHKYSA